MKVSVVSDYHIHLRQGPLMNLVTGVLKQSAVKRCYVMPNTIPPVNNTKMALDYKAELQKIDPSIDFLMTLYLSTDLTEQELILASSSGIKGVKLYPKGVTTNSEHGIQSLKDFYSQFRVMERLGMVLNIHGEVPSDGSTVCVLDAEEKFLVHLVQLAQDFPKLKIVLEHVTTAKAVECVKSLPDTVAATITLHHLAITVDDWAGNPHHYCKPVAKYPSDRSALQKIVKEGNPKFFLGTDSAPHPKDKKESCCPSAGVYTGAFILLYCAHILDSFGALDKINGFINEFGNRFYGLPAFSATVELIQEPFKVPEFLSYEQGTIVPFMNGKTLKYSIKSNL